MFLISQYLLMSPAWAPTTAPQACSLAPTISSFFITLPPRPALRASYPWEAPIVTWMLINNALAYGGCRVHAPGTFDSGLRDRAGGELIPTYILIPTPALTGT